MQNCLKHLLHFGHSSGLLKLNYRRGLQWNAGHPCCSDRSNHFCDTMWHCRYRPGRSLYLRLLLKPRIHNSTSTSIHCYKVAASNNIVYYKVRCEQEMKSTMPYQVKLGVDVVGGSDGDVKSVTQVVYTECSCPAGKAPHASCKHLAAFLYAMEEFSQLGYTRDCVTCTDELQAGKKSHKKKSEPIKLSEMSWSKSKRKTSKTKRQAEDHQDPRALSERGHVAARLHARLEDLESRRNGLFLVMSDPLHAARERQA